MSENERFKYLKNKRMQKEREQAIQERLKVYPFKRTELVIQEYKLGKLIG